MKYLCDFSNYVELEYLWETHARITSKKVEGEWGEG